MLNDHTDFATLCYPFQTGALTWQNEVLFLRARAGTFPSDMDVTHLDCWQSFKPYADELTKATFRTVNQINKTYLCVLVLPPPQRDEARAIFAQALRACAKGGVVVVSMQNNAGAKSGESDLKALAGEVFSLSKNKCRVFWANTQHLNDAAIDAALAFDMPRKIDNTGFVSRPGVFAWDRIDAASQLLAEHFPKDFVGHGADLGSGFGYLTHRLLSENNQVVAMDLFEAENRALECAKLNCEKFSERVKLDYVWHDVSRGLDKRYNFIVSNPPFHQGKQEIQALGQAFITAAANALNAKGRFFMVANTHLPYEAVLKQHFSNVNTLAMRDGYKVFEAIRAAK